MMLIQMCICVILLERMVFIHALTEDIEFGWNDAISNQTATAYNIGIHMGIINPAKYSLKSFEKNQPIFKDAYKEFVSLLGTELMSYQKWLEMNNYGIIYSTEDSLFEKKSSALRKRQHSSTKSRFMRTVRTGDILISTKNSRGLVGHAAIMVSDYWVLEMRSSKKSRRRQGSNRQIPKSDWFNDYGYEWTTVFRCPDSSVAQQAAYWADRAYFNPNGGQDKTICVSYEVTPDFASTNPSYSSKLVLQAYYYGASGVIGDVNKYGPVIAPTRIPSYFMPPYELIKMGKF